MASNEDVSDYGIECLKKVSRVPDTSSPTRYALRTCWVDTDGNILSPSINDDGQMHVVLSGKVCSCNTTKTLLGADETFTGLAGETLDYAMIMVSVYADQDSATNGLRFETSSDNVTWYLGEEYTYLADSDQPYSLQPSRRYFRIVYTNGSTPQGEFDLETIYKKTNCKPSSHRIEDDITGEKDAELVKAVITGKKPNGDYTNFKATASGNFKMSLEEFENGVSVNSNSQLKTTTFDSSGNEIFTADYPARVDLPSSYFDDFGKFGVASPYKLFEYSSSYPLDTTRYWSTSTTGSGTVTRNATKTQIEFATTTASGDKAILQSRRNVQYNKANAQEIYLIYKPNATANRRERWGYFDDNNGVFFEHDGTNARLVVRSNTSGSPVDTKFEQAAWDDPLDGNGASGKTIDWTKQTVFKISFGWLSSRGVRFWIDVGGSLVVVKTWYISNSLTVPFMKTAQLPIRIEVENTDTVGSSVTSAFSCCAIQSSGSDVQEGPIQIVNGLSTPTTPVSVGTTETTFLGYRLNSNYVNGSLQPLNFSFLPASGTTFCTYKVYYNATLVGDNWSAGASGVHDYLTSVTSFSGGSLVESGVFPLARSSDTVQRLTELLNDIYVGRDLSGARDTIIVTLQTNTGSGTVFLNARVKEFS